MRKSYLENHRRGIYSGLLLSGELKKHLLMIQEQAEERFEILVEQMAKQEGVTEQLKAQDQMLWVRRMNNIRARAEEIVREEIVYKLYVNRIIKKREGVVNKTFVQMMEALGYDIVLTYEKREEK